MATRQTNHKNASQSRRPPATTPEARENQLIAKAVELAEKQLSDGTASAQVITHYLKLGSSRERLEQERLNEEVQLLKAKAENMQSMARAEGLMAEALNAFRSYSGKDTEPSRRDDDDYED